MTKNQRDILSNGSSFARGLVAAADSRQPCEDRIIPEPLRHLALEDMGYDKRQNSCRTCIHRKAIDDKMQDRSWIEVCDLLRNSLGLLVIAESAVCRFWQGATAVATPQAKKEVL